jgi:hypothetical protein
MKGTGIVMNQLYAEAGVKRKDTAASMGLKVLMIIGVIIAVFFLVAGSFWSYIGVVIIVGVFFLFPRLNVEYEYVFVDGQIDFDKITGKTKRKTLLRIDIDQIEIMAPIGSHALDNFNNIRTEVRNYSSLSKESKTFVIIANADNRKLRIIFEPSEKMLTMIKQKSPRKITTY